VERGTLLNGGQTSREKENGHFIRYPGGKGGPGNFYRGIQPWRKKEKGKRKGNRIRSPARRAEREERSNGKSPFNGGDM